MNTKEIEALIKFVQRSGVSEVMIEDKDFKITIKTSSRPSEPAPLPVIAIPQVQPILNTVSAPGAGSEAPKSESPATESKLITVKSPMIGTFYRSAGPDKPVFVNVGDEIKQGQVICIIEAMKLFNEIESEVKGKVVKVLVDNSSPIEYDQPLFLVEPN